ncbi:MAG: hypothetical protein M0R37_13880 [Bacteroidales bacterium]|jgi:hypothetical protein|nr:hypothetical protein [Bacteroidales bacterium]
MASRVTVRTKPIAFPRRVDVRVGILEPGDEHEGGMTVGELAEIHEFGLGDVPDRAPIRSFFDLTKADLVGIASKQFEIAARGRADLPAFTLAAERVAVKAAAGLRNHIAFGNLEPDLAESTKKSKERRGIKPPWVPLIETGVLRNHYIGDAEVTP